jgi:hypothetical protein
MILPKKEFQEQESTLTDKKKNKKFAWKFCHSAKLPYIQSFFPISPKDRIIESNILGFPEAKN